MTDYVKNKQDLENVDHVVNKLLPSETLLNNVLNFRNHCTLIVLILKKHLTVSTENQYGKLHIFTEYLKSLLHYSKTFLNSTCCIKTEKGFTDYFPIETGVRQGCILSLFLFIMVLDFIMRKSTIGSNLGIKWQMNSYLSDLDFADDIALLEESFTKQQELTTNLEQNANKVGLRVSVEKTKAMKIAKDANTNHIKVNDQPIDNVKQFKYLGSISTDDGDVEIDV